MRLDTITLEIAGRTVSRSWNTARPDQAVCAEDLVTSWQRAHPFAGHEPYDLAFNLYAPINTGADTVKIDDQIAVRFTAGQEFEATVFAGYIDEITRHRGNHVVNGIEYERLSVRAICIKGRLARTRVGDTPWPAEYFMAGRLERLHAIAPFELGAPINMDEADGEYMPRAPRLDIDSQSPIDVLETHVKPFLQTIVSTEVGLQSARSLEGLEGGEVYSAGTNLEVLPGWLNNVQVDAARVPDVDLVASYDSGLSAVTLTYYVASQSGIQVQKSRTYGDTSKPGVSIDLDCAYLLETRINPDTEEELEKHRPPEMPYTAPIIARMIEETPASSYRLSPIDIKLSRQPDSFAATLAALCHMPTRWLTGVEIRNGRPGVPIANAVMGGTLTLSGNPDRCVLTLDLAPAAQFTGGTLTFAQLENAGSVATYEGSPWPAWRDFSDVTSVLVF